MIWLFLSMKESQRDPKQHWTPFPLISLPFFGGVFFSKYLLLYKKINGSELLILGWNIPLISTEPHLARVSVLLCLCRNAMKHIQLYHLQQYHPIFNSQRTKSIANHHHRPVSRCCWAMESGTQPLNGQRALLPGSQNNRHSAPLLACGVRWALFPSTSDSDGRAAKGTPGKRS